MTNAFLSILKELESYNKLCENLRKPKTTALVSGATDSAKCHLSCALSADLNRTFLFVAKDEGKAREIHRDASFFTMGQAVFYPSRDMFHGADVNAALVTKERLKLLSALAGENVLTDGNTLTGDNTLGGGAPKAIACSVEALFDQLIPKEIFANLNINLESGNVIDADKFLENLVLWGYERVHMVERAGQFASRGGIIDLFSPAWHSPARIELFGDEVDSIRFIDPLTQRSTDKAEIITVQPAREYISGLASSDFGVETTFLDYLPSDTIIFLDEPSRMSDIEGYDAFVKKSASYSRVLLAGLVTGAGVSGFSTDGIFSFTVKSGAGLHYRADALAEEVRYLTGQDYRVLILAGGRARMERLFNELTDEGLSVSKVSGQNIGRNLPLNGMIYLSEGTLSNGFEYPLIKFACITASDVSGTKKLKKPRGRRKDGTPVTKFSDLVIGDYVVHNTHGIGVYRGIEKIRSEDISRDYLKISYADGGNLYVSAAGLDVLQKYLGGEDSKPRIHKLGGQEFSRAKARVRSAVREIAGELKELYAKREQAKGHIFSPDTVWQTEFEESFPHEETNDQLLAVSDIKADMESGKVMDRLICGDVGYGKTEVAIRAAFKAVTEGKQVAFLAPTTILAQQHYNTIQQRMRDFPITIDLLSRFRTAANMRDTVRKLAVGAVDIVVGTHRLLSKDVKFKDLGLIVVDEEQRFGVAHKERLKQLRANVNVLTLTATPIPRTLHMSLTGIRDMSLLDEPPLERIPIQTYVLENNPDAVRDAIQRELARDGQVYFLHNRVRNIYEAAKKVADLVPEASVAVGHGQMNERELENVMLDFIEGNVDVLVCTTIIENGLDIPNANTIIIQDADFLGLSSLYQLRGRVGRSNRAAYCYLMYHKDKVLTEPAEKRLTILRTFTEFGAGYKIALRDLSMRGAGNVLGAEQHGHMDAVGIEMYLKLLGEALAITGGSSAGKGEEIRDFETHIDIPIDAYIPESYISNEMQKLDAYRRISQIDSDQTYLDVMDELVDRYGEPPKCLVNLLDIAALKAVAHRLDATSVTKKRGNLVVSFLPDAGINPEVFAALIAGHKGRLFFSGQDSPALTYKPHEGEDAHISLKRILAELL